MFILSYKDTLLYTQPLSQKFDGQAAKLVVGESHLSSIFGLVSSTNVIVAVVNEVTNKRVPRKYWDSETAALVEQKKQEYKPSFFKRAGKLLLFTGAVIAIFAAILFTTVFSGTREKAAENFTKAYGSKEKAVWLESLQVGDILLANKKYDDPVQVFRIKEFTDKAVILEAFDQFIPMGEYEELDKLNSLDLGNTSSNEIKVSLNRLQDGLIYDLAVDSSLSQLYIQQIRKGNK